MKKENLDRKFTADNQRSEILEQLEEWLDLPMLFLSLIWLILLIVELVGEGSPFFDVLTDLIWVIFILNFALEFFIAPHKLTYLKKNWLTVVSLFLPALRLLRFFRYLGVFQKILSLRGIQLLRLLLRTNRGMKTLASTFKKRGFGYVLGLTVLVIFVGAAGMYSFERDVPDTGITDFGTALWWTAMMMTTMGSDYFPKTPEGRILCWFLSLYAFTVFGYLTATITTFFLGKDANNRSAEVASEELIAKLQQEITLLREEIHLLFPQKTDN